MYFSNSQTKSVKREIHCLVDSKLTIINTEEEHKNFKNFCLKTFNEMMYFYNKNDMESTGKILKNLFNDSSIAKYEYQMDAFLLLIVENAIFDCFNYQVDPYQKSEFYYQTIDNVARFIVQILMNNTQSLSKIKFFEKVLFSIYRIMHLDYVTSKEDFQCNPYYKLITGIINLLYYSSNELIMFSGGNKKVFYFYAITDFLKSISPSHYPLFAMSWLDIVSNKFLTLSLLESEQVASKENCPKYEKYLGLLTELISLMNNLSSVLLKEYSMKDFLTSVYKFFYYLVKAYPDFISFYYFQLINAFNSDQYTQIVNIILSATPSDIVVVPEDLESCNVSYLYS